MKHYGLYDRNSTCLVLGGISILYVLTFGLCSFFVKRFVFESLSTTGTIDLSVIPLLVFFLLPPFVIIPIVSHKSHAISRYLLRCTFSKEGIYCFGFLWKSFFISWDSIRTYGIQGYNYSYVSLAFLFVSAEKEYCKKGNIAKISTNRILFQLRDDIISPLLEFMPLDMKSKLKVSIEESRDIYIQR